MSAHRPRFRGWRRGRVVVACRCGWVCEACPSRGKARRVHDWHVWRAETHASREFWEAVDYRRRAT